MNSGQNLKEISYFRYELITYAVAVVLALTFLYLLLLLLLNNKLILNQSLQLWKNESRVLIWVVFHVVHSIWKLCCAETVNFKINISKHWSSLKLWHVLADAIMLIVLMKVSWPENMYLWCETQWSGNPQVGVFFTYNK